MVRLRATSPITFKTPDGIVKKKPGDVFGIPKLEPVVTLIRAGKALPAEPCPWCRRYAWWISIYGNVICGNCHPPATPEIVEAFLEVPCGN